MTTVNESFTQIYVVSLYALQVAADIILFVMAEVIIVPFTTSIFIVE